MKSVIALVVLALAVCAHASVWPGAVVADVAGHGLSYTAVSGPAAWGHGAWGHGAWAPGAWAAGAWPGAWAGAWPAAAPWTAHGPAHVAAIPAAVHAAAWPHAHEGSYVAKTRGAIHTAPLAGHANSAASINVAPAPGTV